MDIKWIHFAFILDLERMILMMKKIVIIFAVLSLVLVGCQQEKSTSTSTDLASAFPKSQEAFGIKLYATNGVSDEKLTHARNILAEYLDGDNDGKADNQAVVDKMVERHAAMIMFKDEKEAESFNKTHQKAMENYPNQDSLQDLYAREIHIDGASKGEFDASLEEVLHLITHVGYSHVYPNALGEKAGTSIANAMDKARGGHFQQIPKKYPDTAWYSYYDDTADYSTMITEYVYWSLTSLLGGQSFDGRLDQIQHEWKLNTPEKVMTTDPDVTSILHNPDYHLPTVLPDGKYPH